MKSVLIWILLGLCVEIGSCGGKSDDQSFLDLRIISPSAGLGPIRRFNDPLNPPDRIEVQVDRSSDPSAKPPVAYIEQSWDSLPEDTYNNNQKFLLITVPPNNEKNDPYLLTLKSVVIAEGNVPTVDECGSIGEIVTIPGKKTPVSLVTHLGDCTQLCVNDSNCTEGVGDHYCLSFECKPRLNCSGQPPVCEHEGAYCQNDGAGQDLCSGSCGNGSNPCLNGFGCCGSICVKARCPSTL